MPIRAVFFDVGETLISEARLWDGWAQYLGVRTSAFRAALDDAIARGEHHREVFERFCPGFDLDAARRERAARGDLDVFDSRDLYPDAIPCLKELRRLGYVIGLAGNQPEEAEAALRQIGFAADFIGSSAAWGIEKPSPAFFAKICDVAGLSATTIAYAGDRIDNDVIPARNAGMVSVFLERGPWGRIHAKRPAFADAHLAVQSLEELPEALERFQVSRT